MGGVIIALFQMGTVERNTRTVAQVTGASMGSVLTAVSMVRAVEMNPIRAVKALNPLYHACLGGVGPAVVNLTAVERFPRIPVAQLYNL